MLNLKEKQKQLQDRKKKCISDLTDILHSFDYYSYLNEEEKKVYDTIQTAIELLERGA